MATNYPTKTPSCIEKFVEDFYKDPAKFHPDAIEFSKETNYKISYTAEIDKDGNAKIETIWFWNKQDPDLWYEYDVPTKRLN